MNDKGYSFRIPKWSELPTQDLYMEQVLKYVNSELGSCIRDAGLAPITKSMINNYVKAHLIDPPVNKKYSRQSIAMIIVMYILKSCYSIEEVGKILQLGLSYEDKEYAYTTLCGALETAVEKVFSGEFSVSDKGISDTMYLVENFALSFACKLYVTKTFLASDTEKAQVMD